MVIIETGVFTRLVRELMSDDEYSELQKALLKKQGCDLLQGYYLGRPEKAAIVEERFLTRASTELKQVQP